MLYGCRNAPFKGWADGITGSSEVNSGSSACELPGLEAQQSTYESKRSSFSLNSFFAGASSTLAGCVTTKPRIDVASFDQLQSRLVYRCCGDQSANSSVLSPKLRVTRHESRGRFVSAGGADSVTDEHALLLAAMKCHVMALGREGDGCDVGGTSNCGLCCSICSQTKWDWR